jgi:quinohemoprotein ethanol dehydrogenase
MKPPIIGKLPVFASNRIWKSISLSLLAFSFSALLGACSEEKAETPVPDAAAPLQAEEPKTSFADHVKETTARMDGARIGAADSEPGNWLAHGRTYGEQRYSPLTEINDKTVGDLGLAWSFDTQTTRGLEASPIVIDGVMYTTGSWSTVFALNAKTGEQLWAFDPEVPREWAFNACCDVVNRGVAVWKGKVYLGTIDGRLIALDAADGSVTWEVMTIDQSRPYTITGAPRIVKDKVIIGNGGAEYGVRGYFTAYDAATGDQAWRFYTVPGNPEEPYEHPELEDAAKTWPLEGKYWEIGGGGTVWDSMAYDPELDLLYVGTGNGSPWSRFARSPGGGDNLFLSSILAIRPDSGELAWHYQTTPGDSWDYTATQHIILADMEIGGTLRKVLMQAPKNGFFYVLDRVSGELLSAKNYAVTTWASHVDMETGRPVELEDASMEHEVKVIFPSPLGGHNWHPMAYNPDTGLVYIPGREAYYAYANDKNFAWQPGAQNQGLDTEKIALFAEEAEAALAAGAEFPEQFGLLLAWDPVKQEKAWAIKMPVLINGGVLTTAGNLVFQGTGDGRFVAYAADTGVPLWAAPVQTGMIAPPVTYSVDGEQYVAIMVGWGGVGIATGGATLPTIPDSPISKFGNEGRLLVFKLGGGDLPVLAERDESIPKPPVMEASAATIHQGSERFIRYCAICHGAYAISSGVAPDLRRMSPETHEIFNEIVLNGLYKDNGMIGFSEWLSTDDADAIHAYLVDRANISRAAFPETAAE